MRRDEENDNCDPNQLIVKLLYFGLVVNILAPAAGLLVCHYVDSNYGRHNIIGDLANPVFFVFAALALLQAGFALWWRAKRLRRPMISGKERFEQEIITGLLGACRPVFVVIAAISVYGYLYFFLSGRFTETLVFIVFSFIVFQVVRPSRRFTRKLIARQKELLERSQPQST